MPLSPVLGSIRALDLCDQRGAYCGKALAEMGADVVLVEPLDGSPMRGLGPFHPEATPQQRSEASLFFWHYNTNKRSIMLDLDSEAGRQQLLRLVADVDLIIESFPPGDLAARQLTYEALAAANPAVVLTSITPFGQTGPYRDFRASDLVAQALGGLAYVNGFEDDQPLQGVGLPAYHAAGMWAAVGSLLALLDREQTGVGQWVDVSMHACTAAFLEHATSLYRERGVIAKRTGPLHWTRSFRTGPCRNGYVAQAVTGDWTALAEWVNAELDACDLTDACWSDAEYRHEHSDRLFATLDRWAADKSADHLEAEAQLRRLPYAALQPLEALLSNPQLRARNHFVPVRYDTPSVSLQHSGAPYAFSRMLTSPPRRAPRLGEHNHEVLTAPRRQDRPASPPLTTVTRPGRPLEGLRVLDFTWAVAGPLATRILADEGADVIKIERPGTLRNVDTPGLATHLNRGKRSIAIDMSRDDGVALVRRLAAVSDVVIDNFSPRVMRNWGLDDETLRLEQPRLISLGMSGFGATGPFQDRVSYGPTLQAAGGHSLLMQRRDLPVGWGFSYSDMVAGHSAALAIVMALWHRRQTGGGQRIDLSQFETLIAVTGSALLAMQTGALEPPGNDSQEADAAPHGVYRCADEAGDEASADRWCAIAVFDDRDWQRLRSALSSPAWAADPRFDSGCGRRLHHAEIDAQLSWWTRPQRAYDVMHRLQRAGVAAGVVANAKDLCERDPQLRWRGYWTSLQTDDGRRFEVDGTPLLRSAQRAPAALRTPRVGEHTDVVLSTLLGFDDRTLAQLRHDRIVA